MILLLACAQEEEVKSVQLGTLTAERAGEQAEVVAARAFGYDAGGRAVVWFSGNPDATCEAAAAWLAGQVADPSGLLLGGTCEAAATLSYDGAPVTHTSDPLSVELSLGCAMDDDPAAPGAWSSAGGSYVYSGHWWEGSPDLDGAWSLGLAPAEGGGYTLSLDMRVFEGGFVYESGEAAPANGTVTGEVAVAYCEELAQASIF